MKRYLKLFFYTPLVFGYLVLMSANAEAQNCVAKFSYQQGSAVNNVTFASAVNSTSTHYFWNFGDGTSSNVPNPSHTFANGGIYWVCLTVTDSANVIAACKVTWCDSVRVGNSLPPSPVCNAKFAFKAGNTLYSVVFTGSANNSSSAKYFWSFGDGGTSTISNPFHTYPGPGSYWACLTVSDSTLAGVCKNTFCDSIRIGSPTTTTLCDAHFTHQPGNVLYNVVFASSPSSTITRSYSWTFGDGSTSNLANPNHTYPGPGSYWVCLTVSDSSNAAGCKSTWCDSIKIGNVVQPPVCNAQFTHKAGSSLYSEAFIAGANSTVSKIYYWTFGDGGTSVLPNPLHIYPGPGSYWACLTVSDSNSAGVCKITWCDSVRIGNPSNTTTCNARFKFAFANTFNNVSFTSAINPPGTRFFWNFGDGTSSNISNPTHTFSNTGVYWVCLTVSDSTAAFVCKQTWCDSVYIKIPPPPPACSAHFTIKPGTTVGGVGFAPAPNPAGTQFFWDFGDGTTSNMMSPYHTYQHGGVYLVCLTVRDSTLSGLCQDKWCDSVKIGVVSPPPPNSGVCNAQFKYIPSASVLRTLYFSSAVNPSGATYYWDFGDGYFSNLPNPSHTYGSSGPFRVCLTVSVNTAANLCKNTWCTSISPRYASVQSSQGGQLSIIVYPNPMSENATVTLQNTINPVSFSIYDAMGRMVYHKRNLSDGSFDIGRLFSQGLYFYRVQDAGEVNVTGKLVVQ